MFPDALAHRSAALISLARERSLMLGTAESCTGGLVAALITEIPGSSDVFDRGFVTYSNAAKAENLDVPLALLNSFGAVSAEVAGAMATGVLAHSNAQVAVSITGIAGPGGGSPDKPVGLVHFGCAVKGGGVMTRKHLFGDRGRCAIRMAAVVVAIELLFDACQIAAP
ncbi:CinA family protein [Methylocapsa palsarum]|uniref:Nicotinamide-nucleotide amidase n=1 Tax=Methylocapsa palsarum TaxID=1612308 RepID=A0A1I3Y8T0_9HYPH|nr:CinA family protein [Methylocapsa palsarum]SFK28225.1 nicotinamide-nucleotide amidase [Methylocapsa palsarum]